MSESNVPEDRTSRQPVSDVLAHINNHLERLHTLCQRLGFSAAVETALRTDLESERDILQTLPPDSPLLEATALFTQHTERSDLRYDMTRVSDIES